MRKKQLIEKMVELVEAMNKLEHQLKDAKAENEEMKATIALLEAQLKVAEQVASKAQAEDAGFKVDVNVVEEDNVAPEAAEPEQPHEPQESVETETSAEPEKTAEPTKTVAPLEIKTNEVPLADSAKEYGSVIIGKLVIESVKYANLIGESDTNDKKELLNLIMGRAEVAKAEIFAATESEAAFEVKKDIIDAQYAEALDYFKSAYGQI
ncbi:MAG: hypothetical protein IIX54_01075 [Clostridia bacterium]|nr:hypothetical protein [Clostridia bacterium]